MSHDKPPVPRGDAKIWHNRRTRDSLGYYRARTMVNKGWCDSRHLVSAYLIPRLTGTTGVERELLEAAINAAKQHTKGLKRGATSNEEWRAAQLRQRQAVFGAVDALLIHQQAAHKAWWHSMQPMNDGIDDN